MRNNNISPIDSDGDHRPLESPPVRVVSHLPSSTRETQADPPKTRRPRQKVVPCPRLVGLEAEAFAHPLDRQAISALRRFKGFDWAVGKAIEWQHEKRAHVVNTSSSVRVTTKQLPRINQLLSEACTILDMDEPELYVAAGAINAFTSGHNNPYIVLFSGLVDAMDDLELQAVIAHELGHIKCHHVLYKEMVRWLAEIGMVSVGGPIARRSSAAAAGVGMFARHFLTAMTTWDQKTELSADRAAMLVVQDEAVCIRMLLKLAGAPARFTAELSVDEFLDQARHLQDLTLDSKIASSQRRQLVEGASHPLVVERARHLDMWIQDGQYQKVFADLGAKPANLALARSKKRTS